MASTRGDFSTQSRLIKLCERSGWDPQFLGADHATDENLVDRCIRELVACRGAGRFELAIALADAACGAGLVHSRITTNRERAARALAAQQPAGALAVVKKGWVWPYRLPSLVGPAAAGFSRLRLHGRQSGVRLTFAEKLERLLQVCRNSGWAPEFLGPHLRQRGCNGALVKEMDAALKVNNPQVVLALAQKASGLGLSSSSIQERAQQANQLKRVVQETLIQSAQRLLDEGQAHASLAILDGALERGDGDHWVQLRRARAIASLGRRKEALQIWQGLLGLGREKLAAAAQAEMNQCERAMLSELRQHFEVLARDHGWELRHLLLPDQADVPHFEFSMLQELIEAREAGVPELSLAMVDHAMSAGFENPWFSDNRARALVHLNRNVEAVAIWDSLASSDQSDVRAAAKEMIELYGSTAPRITLEQLELQQTCQTLCRTGKRDEAKQLLLDLLVLDPDADCIRDQLCGLVQEEVAESVDVECRQVESALSVHELLLDALMAKIVPQQS
jgi:tetratricopeptide (TPR) repeat protein